MRALIPPEERLRRARRDRKHYRRRSLSRRAQARFHRDLRLTPHLFLAIDALRVATLRASRARVLDALQGRAVWTLDTAVRLAGMRGFLAASDLTGYLDRDALDEIQRVGLIAEPASSSAVGVDPLLPRPPLMIAHLDFIPPHVALPHGQLVVRWDHLARDIMGTLGWRPDLLERLERAYGAAIQGDTP
jgi:hypothetical protein